MICHGNDTCSVYNDNFTCDDARLSILYLRESTLAQKHFGSPMPWIGLYVTAASIICVFAIIADLFHGFKHKKLWFPCKYFTLNAASLTLIAITVKLPLDLNNPMPTTADQLAKLSGSVFVCVMVGNMMPSLGSMNEKDILTNVVALDILVITVFVNLGIQLNTGVIFPTFFQVHILVMCLMLTILVILNCSALAVPTYRNYLERKYVEIHQTTLKNESEEVNRMFNVEILVKDVEKFWMMSKTGSPQFVMARSATCSAAGALCFLVMVTMIVADLKVHVQPNYDFLVGGVSTRIFLSESASDYSTSTFWILVYQTIGIFVGTIGPASRWFTAKSFSCSKKGTFSFANAIKVDNYWIQRLVEWKERPITSHIRNLKWKRFLEGIKNMILNSCITIQSIVVVGSKIACVTAILLSAPVLFCCRFCKHKSCNIDEAIKVEGDMELEKSRYILLLEGEDWLPKIMLTNISSSLRQLITKAKRKKPKKLLELLGKSTGFKGVVEYDSDQVPHLCPKELPKCWKLPVVTLTSIAIALPSVSNQKVDRLLASVRQGLLYINQIEKCLNTTSDLVDRVEVVWLEVALGRNWLTNDLRKMARNGKTSMDNLEKLAEIAEKEVTEFKNKMNDGVEEIPKTCPINILAANSMYRISKTMLLKLQDNDQMDEELFEKLSIMIADILSACLTNLPRLIRTKCFSSATEKREDSVQQAAHLLGETEEILRLLQKHEIPNWNPDQFASIDHWSASITL